MSFSYRLQVLPRLICNFASIRRYLGLGKWASLRVDQWVSVIHVVAHGVSTFIGKAQLKKAFVQFRKDNGKSLTVTYLQGDTYRVAGHNTHHVVATPTAMVCDCEDYLNQVGAWGKGCCKHGYAVLGHLGYGSLSEYISTM